MHYEVFQTYLFYKQHSGSALFDFIQCCQASVSQVRDETASVGLAHNLVIDQKVVVADHAQTFGAFETREVPFLLELILNALPFNAHMTRFAERVVERVIMVVAKCIVEQHIRRDLLVELYRTSSIGTLETASVPLAA
mgnify:CR=1 FL=1